MRYGNFIGNVQNRKVKDIINEIHYLHSVDRISLVKEIQKRANQTINCFVQVNVSGEASKSGVLPAELDSFIEEAAVYDKVRVIGLMTMAPFTEDMDIVRTVFRSLRELRDGVSEKKLPHAPCTQLSMGMSMISKSRLKKVQPMSGLGLHLSEQKARETHEHKK